MYKTPAHHGSAMQPGEPNRTTRYIPAD